ncbi:8407_t:CDS:2 [Paraglomus occultum]|uniref:Homoserine dehydrogenase n=1 Tax=Paraglomus occultum TaxID=144539 RepID=A0A9N9H3K8_9GLOM|nr:8407_t:CDS:2 [Paraglomus occultum]
MVNVGIIGVGLVGSELINQLTAQISRRSLPLPLKIVALANSKVQLLSNTNYDAIDLDGWKKRLISHGVSTDLSAFTTYLAKSPDVAVVVDNTSNQDVVDFYPEFIKAGLHIVTPNKKAFSGDLGFYKKIVDLAREKKVLIYHESTVGAGLPVINTLKDLVGTGDEIVKIEGIFSGTLSYLFNSFSPTEETAGDTKTFSDIVRIAKENGYTEPDPRDDLNGVDVARKVVILGRLAGIDLSLDTLPVENMVPEPLRAVASADEFLTKLPDCDDHFDQLKKAAQNNNKVLRYVGAVDPVNGKSSVSLLSLSTSHPFASLKGSDNIIAFTTKRFPNPLIIQGAGAGAAVTAFGIFSDLIKIAERTSS